MEGLIDGDYTPAESTAPIGFVLTMEPHPFTIQAPNRDVDLGGILNSKVEGVDIPMTGGTAADWVYLSALGLALLAGVGALGRYRTLRSRPTGQHIALV